MHEHVSLCMELNCVHMQAALFSDIIATIRTAAVWAVSMVYRRWEWTDG